MNVPTSYPLWVFNVRTIGNNYPSIPHICKALHGFVDEVSTIRHAVAIRLDGTTVIKGRGPEEDIKAIAHCLEVIGLGVLISIQEDAA